MKNCLLVGLIFLLILTTLGEQKQRFILFTSQPINSSSMNMFQYLFSPKDKRTLAEIVGPLKANADYKGWYESEPVQIPYVGKAIAITFCQGDDAAFMEKAEVVLKRFLRLTSEDRLRNSKWVNDYYSLCVKELGVAPLNIKKDEDVWNFVSPTDVFIERTLNGKYYVSISFTCEWEKNNGLQLVFRDGKKLTRVSGHDGQYEDWN